MTRRQAKWYADRLPTAEVLDHMLGDDPTQALLNVLKSRAPVEMGVEKPPSIEDDPVIRAQFELAAAAAKKLKASMSPTLTDEEMVALDVLTHLVSRPAVRTVDGTFGEVPESWPELQAVGPNLAKRVVKAVGRLDTHDRSPTGTGWFIVDDIIVTNNHVTAGLCGINPHQEPDWREQLDRAVVVHNEKWNSSPELRPTWDLGDEPSPSRQPTGRITQVLMTHPKVDMAFLAAEVPKEHQSVLSVAASPTSEPGNLSCYLVGYPALLPNHEHHFHKALVKLIFSGSDANVHKRVSPGRLIGVNSTVAEHDSSTLGGSSGSPVIDLGSHMVVGLHFSGRYGINNNAVALWELNQDPVFSDFGIKFL